MNARALRCALVLVVLSLAVAALVAPATAGATAETFNVTGQADGAGSCSGGPPIFSCTTLRAALTNLNTPGPNTINLPASGSHYMVNSDLPEIKGGSTTIVGGGAASTIIDASGDSGSTNGTMFTNWGNSQTNTLNIQNLTVEGNPHRQGILVFTAASVDSANITDSVIQNNTNSGGNPGGGILVFGSEGGTLNVTDSTISGNSSSATAGGGLAVGGAVSLKVTGTTIAGNSTTGGQVGGAFAVGSHLAFSAESGSTDIRNSTITGNMATGSGSLPGGTDIFLNTTKASFSYDTIAGNSAATSGNGPSATIYRETTSGGTFEGTIVTNNTTTAAIAGSAPCVLNIGAPWMIVCDSGLSAESDFAA